MAHLSQPVAPPILYAGERVVLHSLPQDSRNGRLGCIMSWGPQRGQYFVLLDTRRQLCLKPENFWAASSAVAEQYAVAMRPFSATTRQAQHWELPLLYQLLDTEQAASQECTSEDPTSSMQVTVPPPVAPSEPSMADESARENPEIGASLDCGELDEKLLSATIGAIRTEGQNTGLSGTATSLAQSASLRKKAALATASAVLSLPAS